MQAAYFKIVWRAQRESGGTSGGVAGFSGDSRIVVEK
jgi:hypothetical protein